MDLHATLPRSGDGLDHFDGPPDHLSADPEGIRTVEVEPVVGPPTESSETEPALPPEVEVAPPTAEADATEPEPEPEPAKAAPKLRRRRRVARRRWDAPAWMVSALIHVGILGGLAAVATSSGEVVRRLASINGALTDTPSGSEELTKIYADPSENRSEMATGDTAAAESGASFTSSIGGSAPSATPAVRGTGRAIGEKTGLPTMPRIAAPSGVGLLPPRPTMDLGGGGLIGGDVTFVAGEVGEALDQISHEILRHLTQHKVTVVWLFDESESMRDDQREIKKKFDRVVNELKINTPDENAEPPKGTKKRAPGPPLTHAIVGFGDEVHFELDKPTVDIDLIGKAIDRLRIDSTGKENTMSAVAKVIAHYRDRIGPDRKLLVVLVTDESGDDGEYVEEARQAATSREVPIYVIGRQALFGFRKLAIDYRDPVTNDVYRVHIDRGPETADFEALQWDGIHFRWDEQPSGFAPYELARLAKDSAGIYFLLPSEEGLRVRRREKAYSMATLKEYVPDYESRSVYAERRQKSELRRNLFEIIQQTRKYPFRHSYSVEHDEMIAQVEQDIPTVTFTLNALIAIEERLRQLEKARDREPEKRWQAAYDLMRAQIVAYQIKAYEYRAVIEEMHAKPPIPRLMPSPELTVKWWLNHSHEAKAPKKETEKVYAEATRLFHLVIERHPNTPWADLAQDEINRGFSVHRDEHIHKHNKAYNERGKLVPKF